MPWSASSKRPVLRAIAPVKEPFSWPKSSLSSSPEGDGSAVDFDQRVPGALAALVNGAGDELLARAGLPEDEDAGLRRRDDLDLLDHRAHRGAAADELAPRPHRGGRLGAAVNPPADLQGAGDFNPARCGSVQPCL